MYLIRSISFILLFSPVSDSIIFGGGPVGTVKISAFVTVGVNTESAGAASSGLWFEVAAASL
jgi:hypothetical protein